MTLAAAATVWGATAAMWGTAAVISGQGMFAGAIMGSVAYVALRIMRLVCVEVVELLCPARRATVHGTRDEDHSDCRRGHKSRGGRGTRGRLQ